MVPRINFIKYSKIPVPSCLPRRVREELGMPSGQKEKDFSFAKREGGWSRMGEGEGLGRVGRVELSVYPQVLIYL